MSSTTVIQHHMQEHLGLILTDKQADELWVECRKDLIQKFPDTVKVVERSDRSIDTLERGDLLDAIGRYLTGMNHPTNGESDYTKKEYAERIVSKVIELGYQEAPIDRSICKDIVI